MLHPTCMCLGCLQCGIHFCNSLIGHEDIDDIYHLVVAEFSVLLKFDDHPLKRVLQKGLKGWGRGLCPSCLQSPFLLDGFYHAGKWGGHLGHPLCSRDTTWLQCVACGRPSALGVLAFGWLWGWGWGACVDAKIVVLIAAECHWVVWVVEWCTRFLALSAWQFVLLLVVNEVSLNLEGTHQTQILILISWEIQ